MASKLRRAPLFGIDSGFSIVSPSCKIAQTSRPFVKMECEVTASPSSYGTRNNGGSPVSAATSASRSTGNTKSQLHVDFLDNNGEVKEKREKYLTAKYGSHQMNLIRKRLSVEMWLYDELQKLFEAPDGSATTSHDVEIDLDEVLDLDGDVERRKFLQSLLSEAKKSTDVVNSFIDDVIEKAKTL